MFENIITSVVLIDGTFLSDTEGKLTIQTNQNFREIKHQLNNTDRFVIYPISFVRNINYN